MQKKKEKTLCLHGRLLLSRIELFFYSVFLIYQEPKTKQRESRKELNKSKQEKWLLERMWLERRIRGECGVRMLQRRKQEAASARVFWWRGIAESICSLTVAPSLLKKRLNNQVWFTMGGGAPVITVSCPFFFSSSILLFFSPSFLLVLW